MTVVGVCDYINAGFIFIEKFINLRSINISIKNEFPMSEWQSLIHSFGIIWRREQWINSYPKSTINHISDNTLQNWALGCLYTRISVHFYKLHLEISVEHKIIAKYLERVMPLLRVNSETSGPKCVCDDTLNLRTENVPLKIDT